MHASRTLPLIVLVMTFIGLAGCYPQFDYVEEFGPQVRTNLLIFFNEETSNDSTEEFWYQMFMLPDPRGGFQMQDGICRIGRAASIQEHQAISVDFCRNITPAQKDEIMARVRASPIVFKIFEDVIPAEVKEIK
mgnify:CR=1 FL=1